MCHSGSAARARAGSRTPPRAREQGQPVLSQDQRARLGGAHVKDFAIALRKRGKRRCFRLCDTIEQCRWREVRFAVI